MITILLLLGGAESKLSVYAPSTRLMLLMGFNGGACGGRIFSTHWHGMVKGGCLVQENEGLCILDLVVCASFGLDFLGTLGGTPNGDP